MVFRHAEQIVQPYNDNHDVFDLNRILIEKNEIASFVLDYENDNRKDIDDKSLAPKSNEIPLTAVEESVTSPCDGLIKIEITRP